MKSGAVRLSNHVALITARQKDDPTLDWSQLFTVQVLCPLINLELLWLWQATLIGALHRLDRRNTPPNCNIRGCFLSQSDFCLSLSPVDQGFFHGIAMKIQLYRHREDTPIQLFAQQRAPSRVNFVSFVSPLHNGPTPRTLERLAHTWAELSRAHE